MMIWSCHMPSLNSFHALSPVMHIQGCAAADSHHDSFENKQMLLTVQQALKKQERLGKTWNLRSDCAARTSCPLSHGVSRVVRLELLPRNQINLLWTSTATEKWRARRPWHMFTTYCSFITQKGPMCCSRLWFKDHLRFCTETKLIQVTRDWKIKWTDN